MPEMRDKIAAAMEMAPSLLLSPKETAAEYSHTLADIAIKAIRDPTPEMIEAAWRILNPNDYIRVFVTKQNMTEAFRAMIDAA
jgi:hypothetical protein